MTIYIYLSYMWKIHADITYLYNLQWVLYLSLWLYPLHIISFYFLPRQLVKSATLPTHVSESVHIKFMSICPFPQNRQQINTKKWTKKKRYIWHAQWGSRNMICVWLWPFLWYWFFPSYFCFVGLELDCFSNLKDGLPMKPLNGANTDIKLVLVYLSESRLKM